MNSPYSNQYLIKELLEEFRTPHQLARVLYRAVNSYYNKYGSYPKLDDMLKVVLDHKRPHRATVVCRARRLYTRANNDDRMLPITYRQARNYLVHVEAAQLIGESISQEVFLLGGFRVVIQDRVNPAGHVDHVVYVNGWEGDTGGHLLYAVEQCLAAKHGLTGVDLSPHSKSWEEAYSYYYEKIDLILEVFKKGYLGIPLSKSAGKIKELITLADSGAEYTLDHYSVNAYGFSLRDPEQYSIKIYKNSQGEWRPLEEAKHDIDVLAVKLHYTAEGIDISDEDAAGLLTAVGLSQALTLKYDSEHNIYIVDKEVHDRKGNIVAYKIIYINKGGFDTSIGWIFEHPVEGEYFSTCVEVADAWRSSLQAFKERKARRLQELKIEKVLADKEVCHLISIEDSFAAGNCESGTRAWMEEHGLQGKLAPLHKIYKLAKEDDNPLAMNVVKKVVAELSA